MDNFDPYNVFWAIATNIPQGSRFKVLLFVTYTIIQGIISSEMLDGNLSNLRLVLYSRVTYFENIYMYIHLYYYILYYKYI